MLLVASHDGDGALGLVLDRPTDVDVVDLLPDWAPVIVDPPQAFVGGPVQQEVAVGVGRLRAGATPPGGDTWTGIAERVGLLDLGSEDPTAVDAVEAVRVFSGYAGWGPSQLDEEVAAGDWFVVPFHPDDPFRSDVTGLWRRVLARQPGRLALFSHFPDEPRWN